jgi:hypothetical protein
MPAGIRNKSLLLTCPAGWERLAGFKLWVARIIRTPNRSISRLGLGSQPVSSCELRMGQDRNRSSCLSKCIYKLLAVLYVSTSTVKVHLCKEGQYTRACCTNAVLLAAGWLSRACTLYTQTKARGTPMGLRTPQICDKVATSLAIQSMAHRSQSVQKWVRFLIPTLLTNPSSPKRRFGRFGKS